MNRKLFSQQYLPFIFGFSSLVNISTESRVKPPCSSTTRLHGSPSLFVPGVPCSWHWVHRTSDGTHRRTRVPHWSNRATEGSRRFRQLWAFVLRRAWNTGQARKAVDYARVRLNKAGFQIDVVCREVFMFRLCFQRVMWPTNRRQWCKCCGFICKPFF